MITGFCMCVWSLPSILVTVPRTRARRVLHFAVFSGDCFLETVLRSVFSVHLKQPGSHRRGENTGNFFFSFFSLMLRPLLRCFAFVFIAKRVQPSLSPVDIEVVFFRYESEEKPTLAEI